MIKIPVHAQVECTDGSAGQSTAVIINPYTRTLTHLAVEDHEALIPTTRLVPLALVAQTTPDKIQLTCTRAELGNLDIFSETRFIQNEDITLEYLEPYMTPLDVNYLAVESQNVPPGELAVYRGTTVEAADGYIGTVGEFLIDPAAGHITHLILQKGHVWDKKDLLVPVAAIDRLNGVAIYLKLSKAELAGLHSIAVQRDQHQEEDVDLMVWSFSGVDTAKQGLDALKKLVKEKEIKLHNTAVLAKDQDGKTALKEAEDMQTGRGALFGAVTGGIIGLLGGPVGLVIGAAAGAATGGAAAHWIDMGFDNEDLKSLRDSLQPDSSALVALIDSAGAALASGALDELGGERLQQTLTDEMVAQILSQREPNSSEEEE